MVDEERVPVEAGGKFAKGGNVILKVEGVPLPLKLVDSEQPNPFDGKYHIQVVVSLGEATILKVVEGEDEPELKDGVFKAYYNYSVKGKQPSDKTTYKRLFVKSLEDAGTTWGKLVEAGNRVVLEYVVDKTLGYKIPVKGEDGKPILNEEGHTVTEEAKGKGFVLSMSKEDIMPIKDYVRKLVVGKNPSAAKRELLKDNRAKKFPEFREALDNGNLAELLGIMVKDELFTEI